MGLHRNLGRCGWKGPYNLDDVGIRSKVAETKPQKTQGT